MTKKIIPDEIFYPLVSCFDVDKNTNISIEMRKLRDVIENIKEQERKDTIDKIGYWLHKKAIPQGTCLDCGSPLTCSKEVENVLKELRGDKIGKK